MQAKTIELDDLVGKIQSEVTKSSRQARKLIYIGIGVLVFFVVCMLYFKVRFSQQETHLTNEMNANSLERKELKRFILKQDSTIIEQEKVIQNQNYMLIQKDSIIVEQNRWITDFKIEKQQYERAIDSLSIINRFLQRSDLYKRYGTKP